MAFSQINKLIFLVCFIVLFLFSTSGGGITTSQEAWTLRTIDDTSRVVSQDYTDTLLTFYIADGRLVIEGFGDSITLFDSVKIINYMSHLSDESKALDSTKWDSLIINSLIHFADTTRIAEFADSARIAGLAIAADSAVIAGTLSPAASDAFRSEMADTSSTRYDSATAHLDGMSYNKPNFTLYQLSGQAGVQLAVTNNADTALDIVFRLNGVNRTLNTAPDTAWLTLNVGADANTPATNFVYVKYSTAGDSVGLYTSSNLPADSFCWIGKIIIPDTVTFNLVGAYGYQRFTESFTNLNRGIDSHIREKIRMMGAVYIGGLTPSLAIYSTPNPDTLHLTVTAGSVYQLHRQNFPTISNGPYYYGNGLDIYEQFDNLNSVLSEQDGTSLSGKRFVLIAWGAVNYSTGDCKLFINVPNGSYSNSSNADNDIDHTGDYTIPDDMRSVGFLIAKIVLRHQTASSGTWTEIATYSLLGQPPGIRSGGSTAGPGSEEFDASLFKIFDNTDATKIAQFDASEISTTTTRTYIFPDTAGRLVVDSTIPLQHAYFYLSDLSTKYALDTDWCIIPKTLAPITILSYELTLEADPTTELEFSLKWADDFISKANAAIIDDTLTVNGLVSVSGGLVDSTVAGDKCIYLLMDAAPDVATTQLSLDIVFRYDN